MHARNERGNERDGRSGGDDWWMEGTVGPEVNVVLLVEVVVEADAGVTKKWVRVCGESGGPRWWRPRRRWRYGHGCGVRVEEGRSGCGRGRGCGVSEK